MKKLEMLFLRTLFPAFFIWKFLSLSPFTLTRTSLRLTTSNLHNFITIALTSIHLAALAYGFRDFMHYSSYANQLAVLLAAEIQTIALIRCTSILAVIESFASNGIFIEHRANRCNLKFEIND